MFAQVFLALLNPQLGVTALIVGALAIVSVYVYKYRCQMDPELARVRAIEKIINRSLPRWRRRRDDTVDECLKSAITALNTAALSVPEDGNAPDESTGKARENDTKTDPSELDDP